MSRIESHSQAFHVPLVCIFIFVCDCTGRITLGCFSSRDSAEEHWISRRHTARNGTDALAGRREKRH